MANLPEAQAAAAIGPREVPGAAAAGDVDVEADMPQAM